MELWHGGAPGRSVGEFILPPSETGFIHTSGKISESEGLTNITYMDTRVYLTSSIELATAFAAFWTKQDHLEGEGWVYLVETDDAVLEPDGDLLSSPGLSFQTTSARIVKIEQYRVPWGNRHLRTYKRVVQDNENARLKNLEAARQAEGQSLPTVSQPAPE
jgi:hypothetical protein